jgi:L-aminopeptidase/D-esterase-like protein
VITDVPGVRVGHWTDAEARTGCTVVLLPAETVASGEVRGGAPATREFDLLAPARLVAHVDAVLLGGGSAFGLAAADGVVRWCEERGIGFLTPAGPVPIVVAACLFDLAVGDASVRPGPAEGYAACEAATGAAVEVGRVGAGTGATVRKWGGPDGARPGGIGSASCRAGEVVVGALVAVNAFGDLAERVDGAEVVAASLGHTAPLARQHTTIGVVATNARLDKVGCLLVAQSAHDGLARALTPAHTVVDGDAMVAAATGGVDAPVEQVRVLAALAVERAIRSAVPAH